MHVSRCCFCIRLRTGLLIWGYSKLIILICIIGGILLVDVKNWRYVPPVEIAITIAVVLLGTADFIFTVIFVIACHKRNRKLLLVYNGYNIAYLFLVGLVLTGWTMEQYFDLTPKKPIPIHTDLIVNAVLTIVHILWNVYMVIVIASEIRELNKRSENIQYIYPGTTCDNDSDIVEI